MRLKSGFLVLLSTLVGGCYGFAGGGLPPSIKTVAVLPFDNQTPEPTLTQEISRAVREAVEQRLGDWKPLGKPVVQEEGTVNINEAFGATFASIDSPMGGMRQSGMGRRQGTEGIRRYTESQSVAVQKLIWFAPMFGMKASMPVVSGCSRA